MNNDKYWYLDAVIYEFYVDKFAGNFQSLISKLPYLKNLGINTLWLLPHYPSPGVDSGYDISDYYSVRPDLGNLNDFQAFIAAAHKIGLKVITDLVLNHTSIQHPWFSSYPDWYLWSPSPDKFSQAFVHFPELKPTGNWIFDPGRKSYYYATFYPAQADLNWDNPEVVAQMYKVADFWLELGVDGFRLDAISRLVKRDGTNCFALPETHEVLRLFRQHIDSKYLHRVLLAETGGWWNEATPFFAECQLVLNFPLSMHLLAGVPYQETGKFTNSVPSTPEFCKWAGFLTNHDSVDIFFLRDWEEKRWFLKEIDPNRELTNSQETSMGARLAEICKGNPQKILWAFKQLLSLPIVPVIYYGNEIGMRNLKLDPKPADVREFVRGDFDWPEAERQLKDPNSLLNQISHLIKSRSNS